MINVVERKNKKYIYRFFSFFYQKKIYIDVNLINFTSTILSSSQIILIQ